jgi:hypothetical protein
LPKAFILTGLCWREVMPALDQKQQWPLVWSLPWVSWGLALGMAGSAGVRDPGWEGSCAEGWVWRVANCPGLEAAWTAQPSLSAQTKTRDTLYGHTSTIFHKWGGTQNSGVQQGHQIPMINLKVYWLICVPQLESCSDLETTWDLVLPSCPKCIRSWLHNDTVRV